MKYEIGHKQGKLTLLYTGRDQRHHYWTAQCDCGWMVKVSPTAFKRGQQSCTHCRTREVTIRYSPQTGMCYTKNGPILKQTAAGYRMITIKEKEQVLHRWIWLRFVGEVPEGKVLDHINRNKLDNRLINLRAVTTAENARNTRPKGKTTKFKGIALNKKKWRARCGIGGKHVHIGTFDTEIEAAMAYNIYVLSAGYTTNYLNKFD